MYLSYPLLLLPAAICMHPGPTTLTQPSLQGILCCSVMDHISLCEKCAGAIKSGENWERASVRSLFRLCLSLFMDGTSCDDRVKPN